MTLLIEPERKGVPQKHYSHIIMAISIVTRKMHEYLVQWNIIENIHTATVEYRQLSRPMVFLGHVPEVNNDPLMFLI